MKILMMVFFLNFFCNAEEQQMATSAIDAVRNKMALEMQMEEKLTTFLKSYLKTDEVSVLVRLNLLLSKPQEEGTTIRKWDSKEEIVLPGVPASTPMTKKGHETGSITKLLGISSVNIWVMIGKNISKNEEEKIKEIITNSFNLNLQAGDTITIERIKKSFFKSNILRIDTIWVIIAFVFLVIITVFLYIPVRKFFREFNHNLSVFINKITSLKTEESAGEETEKIPEALAMNIVSGGAVSGSDRDIPFEKYVNEENANDLKVILEQEPPDIIAKVIQHLPPKIALSVIPQHKLNEVMAEFLKREYYDPESVKNLLNTIKDRMAGSFGGAHRLAKILQVMDKNMQKEVISILKVKDKAFANELESYFFKFSDILVYDEIALRRIFRKAGVDPFAKCLKQADENTRNTFFDLLGPAIKELITTRMQSIVHVSDTTDAELAILKAVQTLSSQGIILPLSEAKKMKKMNISTAPQPTGAQEQAK